jgi:hypothetical protein
MQLSPAVVEKALFSKRKLYQISTEYRGYLNTAQANARLNFEDSARTKVSRSEVAQWNLILSPLEHECDAPKDAAEQRDFALHCDLKSHLPQVESSIRWKSKCSEKTLKLEALKPGRSE